MPLPMLMPMPMPKKLSRVVLILALFLALFSLATGIVDVHPVDEAAPAVAQDPGDEVPVSVRPGETAPEALNPDGQRLPGAPERLLAAFADAPAPRRASRDLRLRGRAS